VRAEEVGWRTTTMPTPQMKIGFSAVVRIEQTSQIGTFAKVAAAIAQTGGRIGAVDVHRANRKSAIRDIAIDVTDEEHLQRVLDALRTIAGIRMFGVSDDTFLAHLGGKIDVVGRVPVNNRDGLSRVYTPGVARVCLAIAQQRSKADTLTMKSNMVAIVTDGTAVLGLGDIGPYAALPVMEGKAMLFKEFGGVNAFPICLDTKDVDEIVDTVVRIAPGFGGINLEDISSPRCFDVERRLIDRLDIPVMHDDQHGTAIVILAGLINALKFVRKNLSDVTVIIHGVGAAGGSCAQLLVSAGVGDVIGVGREGAFVRGRTYSNPIKQWIADNGNKLRREGSLDEVIAGADVFIGVSAPNVLSVDAVRKMAKDAIVFAMANPVPEIAPELAEPYVAVIATGRSDYPNQVNNLLAFPGFFRGALDARAKRVNEPMFLAAAHAIAGVIGEDEVSSEYVIPSVFDKRVVEAVSRAVAAAAVESGVARRAEVPAEATLSSSIPTIMNTRS
jgi:malate dehydrogenase (oxaloacetate-decarboxylating)